MRGNDGAPYQGLYAECSETSIKSSNIRVYMGSGGLGIASLRIQGVEFMPASVARSSTCDGRRKE